MALLKVENPPDELTNSDQWGIFVERADKNMLGYGLSIPTFTLTNWDAGISRP